MKKIWDGILGKFIALFIINSFFLLTGSWAMDDNTSRRSPYNCLSPAVQINTQFMGQDFQLAVKFLQAEMQEAGRTSQGADLIGQDIAKEDVVSAIRDNIAQGLAVALEIKYVPGNLDKWFAGTSDDAAKNLLSGFDFAKNTLAEQTSETGLAEFLSALEQDEINVIKLKLEQLIRNVKRSAGEEQAKGLRLVVMFGQDKNDPFAQRKILTYSAGRTIYLNVNTLILAETESEKEALGAALAYQAKLVANTKCDDAVKAEAKKAEEKLLAKKKFLSEELKYQEALRLRAQTIEKYSKHDWMIWFRMPGNFQDYIFPWTKQSRDMRRSYCDNVFMPWLSLFSWMSPRNLPVNPFLESWGITFHLRLIGYMSDQTSRTIKWVREVEKEDTDWVVDFEVVKEKANSYRLLEFKRDGYPVDQGALPVLIVNPNAGHDSTVGKDLVDTFLKKGQRVFAFDWLSADPTKPEMVSDLVRNVTDCINYIPGRVQVAALCQGGWVSASAEALLASLNPDKVAAAYMAAVPFYTTKGDNAITETVKTLPEEFFYMLVFYLGIKGVQDGSHQMGGFENMGDVVQKQLGYWLDLVNSIDNERDLKRARGFIKWYYNKFLNLSLWYLEAVFAHFTNNDIYEGRYRTQVGYEMRTVDLSKIKIPLVLLSGTKDDVTAPGVVSKRELSEIIPENVNIGELWQFLVKHKFISDDGESNTNRKPGKIAVIENKVLVTGLKEFLAMDDFFIKETDPIALARVLAFLRQDCYGQCRALAKISGTDPDQILEIIMNRGHIGVFSGGEGSEARKRWQEAIDWVKQKIKENDLNAVSQAAKNQQSDNARIISDFQRKISRDAANAFRANMILFNSANLAEQAI